MTKLGKIVFTLVVLLLAGFAVMRMLGNKDDKPGTAPQAEHREMVTPEGDSNISASFDFVAPGKAQALPSPRPYTLAFENRFHL